MIALALPLCPRAMAEPRLRLRVRATVQRVVRATTETCRPRRPCRPRVDFFQGQQFDQLLLPWPRFRFFRCFVGVFYTDEDLKIGKLQKSMVFFSVLEIFRGLSGYVGDAVVNCSVPGESCLTEAQFGGLGGPGGCSATPRCVSHPVCSLSLRSEK